MGYVGQLSRAVLLIAVAAWGPPPARAETAPLFLGSVAMDTTASMERRLVPLAKYLSIKTGMPVVFRPSPNLSSAVYDLGKGYTQIAYLTPAAYIEGRKKFGIIPIASPLTHGKATFMLVLVVRKDSAIAKPADLRGRKFAFGDEKAVLQRAVVEQTGLKLSDFSAYAFLKHYDNIARAVIGGEFDAGILKDTIAEKFVPQSLRVIHASQPISSYLFAVSASLPPRQASQLRDALLALKPDTPENDAVLKALDEGYTGFTTVTDRDYDVVRSLTGQLEGGR